MNQPNKRLLALLLTALLALLPLESVQAETAELARATQAWKSLSKDAKRRQLRHHWDKAIGDLVQAAQGEKFCSWKQVGLVRAAQAADELASISVNRDDALNAVRAFIRAAETCPKERLSDDAFVYAAEIQARLGDVEGQRRSLERAIAVNGDMKEDAAKVLRTLPPPPSAESKALVDATERFEKMKGDKRLRFYRHNWLTAIRRFEKAGDELAPSKDGAVAYMRGAKASEEVSRISKRDEDARKAVALYLKVADRAPKDSLVDDALLEAGLLEMHRFGNTDAAREHLERAIAFNGDMKAEATRLLRTLPAPSPVVKKAPSPPVVAKKPEPPAPVVVEHDEDVLDGEPLSPDALVEATFGAGNDDLAALLDQVERSLAQQDAREAKDAAATVKDIKREALGGELSLSEQLGAKIRRIVVDAGHGGHDAGAIGPNGVQEKVVTLQIAKRLAKVLRARGYEVVLTREDDTFIALEERTRRANEAKGDLFISIHANAAKSRKQGGIETYALNVASDRFAMRLAARENASTEQSVSDLQFLLADLAARANTTDSDRLASMVQESLVSRVQQHHGKVHDRGVKHALFYVLLGARMPAILVETAFISNAREEKWLSSDEFQDNVARALGDGVDRFVERRTQLASVDR